MPKTFEGREVRTEINQSTSEFYKALEKFKPFTVRLYRKKWRLVGSDRSGKRAEFVLAPTGFYQHWLDADTTYFTDYDSVEYKAKLFELALYAGD